MEKKFLKVDYPYTESVIRIYDELNTHHLSSLYFALDVETARRLKRRPASFTRPRTAVG